MGIALDDFWIPHIHYLQKKLSQGAGKIAKMRKYVSILLLSITLSSIHIIYVKPLVGAALPKLK